MKLCFFSSWFWRPMSLALALVLVSAFSRASEYEYLGWRSGQVSGGRSYGKPLQCLDIPEDLKLCHSVGYGQMLLPNLLEHETMAEVRQQAGSWVPLVHKGCHPGTQVLLCSLFAPVCLDRPLPPCRWLCEAVREGCAPIMEAFGFPWPEMLACDKFPQDDVCIAMTNASTTQPTQLSGPTSVCPPCDNEMKTEAILEHRCASEFVIKAKVKEARQQGSDRQVTLERKRRLMNRGALKKKDLKKLVLYLKNGADCPCQQLEQLGKTYLIMGRKVDEQYLLTGIHSWDTSSAEFRKALRMLKRHTCPGFEAVFK
ncbi:secreted frizzled-related protein 1-like [Megalops cyprinoides]|uniref:secreted frizzled-related protein 1-like n=1 Tax=Megalops cyprinoides TaxID=118141 RepID=UPI001863FE41|nr:secreted frizzled-related protein 1-like [Megalops cyprinoides]